MIELKAFQASDVDAVVSLFTQTVHAVNAQDYSEGQLHAWAPKDPDKAAWIDRLEGQYTQLAWQDGKLLGFGTLTDKGLVDFLFIHHRHQREGLASLICLRLEFEAYQKGISRLYTEASITARPFFEKMGFRVMFPQEKEVRGVPLRNYVMEKDLPERAI